MGTDVRLKVSFTALAPPHDASTAAETAKTATFVAHPYPCRVIPNTVMLCESLQYAICSSGPADCHRQPRAEGTEKANRFNGCGVAATGEATKARLDLSDSLATL